MTAPGGSYDESAHGAHEGAAWASPAGEQPYPPPAYQPPGYPPSYPADPAAGYPPPGYQPPYGGPQYGAQYPPMPPPYGGFPPGPPGPPGFGPSYPGGYYPDYLGGYGTMQTGTNALAIASLVTSIVGVLSCGIASIVAIVLGAVALNQVKQTREDGYGLAVAGIVISVATLLVFLIIALFTL
ncbi:hypothetical protein MSIMFB_04092 [Mycobacterium simulans]|uniref:DUF4190 domain-containing protein n=1 Tax=Mycobacterium simulans TaxID=627089 RepID=A0A7Z7IN15_9MYCO|nr:DUF4190 domain-containing protein [Mycobacterium simulans]SOJ56615.1 hypothetical protein MSIMFB_04092 [Mycobacterium simulans]